MNNLETSLIVNLTGNLVRQADRFSRSMGNMSQRSQRHLATLDRSVRATSGRIDSLGNRAVLGGTAAAYGFERTFIRTAAQFERYRVMLDELQGSSEGGAKALQWIADFTENTPLQLEGVTAAFTKLKTFGLDPMDGSLQSIVDSNAKMGGDQIKLEGIILALGQAWQKQKLQGEEALQLLERGVPVWDLLSEATGRSVVELQKASSQGRLTRKAIKILIDEMGKHSAGSARKQMETWDGMISNMGDHWTNYQKMVMDSGAFDFLKEEMRSMLFEINRMKKSGDLSENAKVFSSELIEGFKTAKDVGSELWQVMKGIGSVLNEVAELSGGYANLAKVLASVYLINKALRFGAPIAGAGFKLGGYLLNRGKGGIPGAVGGGLMGAATQMAPIPVFVVNQPGALPGGFGLGKAGGMAKHKTISKFKAQAGMLGGTSLNKLHYLGAGAVTKASGAVALSGAAGYGVGSLLNEWYGFLDKKLDTNIQATLAGTLGKSMAHIGAALGSEEAQSALAAEAKYQAHLKVEVDDKRVTVKSVESTGIDVDAYGGSMVAP